jgi:uncharacterized membrane protein
MLKFLLVVLAGLAVIALVPIVFYFEVGGTLPLSSQAEDWAIFGNYFGGVTAPLLSFLSILLIVYTVLQQGEQIKASQQEVLKRDLLQYVSRADDEVERWLKRRLASAESEGDVEFGDIVWGIVDSSYVNSKELKAALLRLYKLTCTYCVSLGLYKDNIDTYFIFQQHRLKAEELLLFLESHEKQLSSMAGPGLAACKQHLNSV